MTLKISASTLACITGIALLVAVCPAQAGGYVSVHRADQAPAHSKIGRDDATRGEGAGRDFSVEAVMPKIIYSGHPSWLYVEALNQTTETLRINPTNRPAGARIEIFDAKGNRVPYTAEGQRTFAALERQWHTPSLEVRPGEYVAIAINLMRHFDLTTPGVYTLVVHLAPDYPGGQENPAHTQPLEFRVAAPSLNRDLASQRPLGQP